MGFLVCHFIIGVRRRRDFFKATEIRRIYFLLVRHFIIGDRRRRDFFKEPERRRICFKEIVTPHKTKLCFSEKKRVVSCINDLWCEKCNSNMQWHMNTTKTSAPTLSHDHKNCIHHSREPLLLVGGNKKEDS